MASNPGLLDESICEALGQGIRPSTKNGNSKHILPHAFTYCLSQLWTPLDTRSIYAYIQEHGTWLQVQVHVYTMYMYSVCDETAELGTTLYTVWFVQLLDCFEARETSWYRFQGTVTYKYKRQG